MLLLGVKMLMMRSSCKGLLQNILQEKNIFLGEFIKAILKINNIASECENYVNI